MSTAKLRTPTPLETDMAAAVVDAAALYPFGLFERQNTAAFFPQDANGKTRAVRCGKKGWLDYRFTLAGRYGEVEIKRPGERPTAEQYERMRTLNAINCVGFWVDDVRQFNEVMTAVIREGAEVRINDQGNVVLVWRE